MSRVRFAVMVSAVLGFVFAWSSAMAQISGTDHDFSARGWGSNEICVFCHAPHNTNTTVAGAPLWNHAVTTQTFGLYSSTTLNATMAQPAGVSKLCLSCHDGLTAIDSFGTLAAANGGTHQVTGAAAIGTNLGNDHPIGFAYNAALVSADGGLVTPASTSEVVANVPLFGGNLECSTCHNVHGGVAGTAFLRKANNASALCLSCHTK